MITEFTTEEETECAISSISEWLEAFRAAHYGKAYRYENPPFSFTETDLEYALSNLKQYITIAPKEEATIHKLYNLAAEDQNKAPLEAYLNRMLLNFIDKLDTSEQ